MRAWWSKLLFVGFLGLFVSCAAATNTPCDSALCGTDQRCIVQSDGSNACVATCSISATCADASPICDESQSLCRPCTDGEDSLCHDRSPDAPRCFGGHCVACVMARGMPMEAADCANLATTKSTPICDHNVCRACQRHSECSSGVCAKDTSGEAMGVPQGSCVPFEQVLVVDQTLCSRNGPIYCTPPQAFSHISASQRYVLLRKSAQLGDFTALTLGDMPGQTEPLIHLIGPLADDPPQRSPSLPLLILGGVADKDTLTIVHGHIILEGLFFTGGHIALNCASSDATVKVQRSLFAANDTAIQLSGGCQLSVSESWIGRGPAKSSFAGLAANARGLDVTGSDFHVENTVFTDNGDYRNDGFGGIRVHSLSASGRRSSVVNTTFYQQSGIIKTGKYITSMLCDGLVGDHLVVLNTLFFGDNPLLISPEEHYVDPACGTSLYHLGSNDPLLKDNQSVVVSMAAPLFVDANGRDLRPLTANQQPDRAAIASAGVTSVAVGSDLIAAPDHDLDGKPRGVGGVPITVGAFEPVTADAP